MRNEWWLPLLEPDGLLLRDDALAVVDPDDLLTALRAGRLKRLQRGVYLPRAVTATPLLKARAAIISSGVASAVASHVTAARVHGIEVPQSHRAEHVTVTRAQRRRHRRELHFHSRPLGLGEVERHGAAAVTTVARTLADLAEGLDRLDAVWALDDALRRKLCPETDVLTAVERWRGGAGCLRARVRLGEADGIAESFLETAGRLALADRGVPLPIPQYELRTPEGIVVARLDGAYLREKVALEYDGAETHGVPEAVFRDRWRQNWLPALDWKILRFTYWDVMRDPDGFAETVQRTIDRRAA